MIFFKLLNHLKRYVLILTYRKLSRNVEICKFIFTGANNKDVNFPESVSSLFAGVTPGSISKWASLDRLKKRGYESMLDIYKQITPVLRDSLFPQLDVPTIIADAVYETRLVYAELAKYLVV